jgi:hypothetical protein
MGDGTDPSKTGLILIVLGLLVLSVGGILSVTTDLNVVPVGLLGFFSVLIGSVLRRRVGP